MARITVEDCLENVDNRFDLVLTATRRARQLAEEGARPLIETKNDKPTVAALREIAEGLIDEEIMDQQDQLIMSHREQALQVTATYGLGDGSVDDF